MGVRQLHELRTGMRCAGALGSGAVVRAVRDAGIVAAGFCRRRVYPEREYGRRATVLKIIIGQSLSSGKSELSWPSSEYKSTGRPVEGWLAGINAAPLRSCFHCDYPLHPGLPCFIARRVWAMLEGSGFIVRRYCKCCGADITSARGDCGHGSFIERGESVR